MQNKRNLLLVGIAFGLLFLLLLAGCSPKMVTDFRPIGETPKNNYYGAMVASTNERGPAGMALGIIAERKEPQVASRLAITGTPPSQPAVPQFQPPAESPRGKKALVGPAPPPCPPPQPTQTLCEETYYPDTMVVGGAGGVGPSTLQSWGNALLGNAPAVFSGVFAPGTNIKMGQQQDTNNKVVGINDNTNINPINIKNNNTAIGNGEATAIIKK